jgi:hypothetical protein
MSQPLTDREIMQQALDALEEINKLSIGENAICLPAEIDTAMDALRDRLAQPEQELVCVCGAIWEGQELVSTPPQRKPKQEPVAWAGVDFDIKTTPPQREPLTDEEIDELSRTMVKGNKSVNWLCRAIEAKLKEKNT